MIATDSTAETHSAGTKAVRVKWRGVRISLSSAGPKMSDDVRALRGVKIQIAHEHCDQPNLNRELRHGPVGTIQPHIRTKPRGRR